VTYLLYALCLYLPMLNCRPDSDKYGKHTRNCKGILFVLILCYFDKKTV